MVIVADKQPSKTIDDTLYTCTYVLNKISLSTVSEICATYVTKLYDNVSNARMDFITNATLMEVEYHRDDIISIINSIKSTNDVIFQEFLNVAVGKFNTFRSKVKSNSDVIQRIEAAAHAVQSVYSSKSSAYDSNISRIVSALPIDTKVLTNDVVAALRSGDDVLNSIAQSANLQIEQIVSYIESRYKNRIYIDDDFRPNRAYNTVLGDKNSIVVF